MRVHRGSRRGTTPQVPFTVNTFFQVNTTSTDKTQKMFNALGRWRNNVTQAVTRVQELSSTRIHRTSTFLTLWARHLDKCALSPVPFFSPFSPLLESHPSQPSPRGWEDSRGPPTLSGPTGSWSRATTSKPLADPQGHLQAGPAPGLPQPPAPFSEGSRHTPSISSSHTFLLTVSRHEHFRQVLLPMATAKAALRTLAA